MVVPGNHGDIRHGSRHSYQLIEEVVSCLVVEYATGPGSRPPRRRVVVAGSSELRPIHILRKWISAVVEEDVDARYLHSRLGVVGGQCCNGVDWVLGIEWLISRH